VYDASYGGAAAAEQWQALTLTSAAGGVLLFTSSAFFLLVMLGTVAAGKRVERKPLEFAEPLHPPGVRAGIFDRMGIWVGAGRRARDYRVRLSPVDPPLHAAIWFARV